jgi:hypothetical protein
LQFSIPEDNESYIDTNIHIYVSGKLTVADGKDLEPTDHMDVTINFLHSLFSHCTVTLNGVPITQYTEHYNYRSMLETLLTYGSDVTKSHLTNAYWYRESGDMLPCEPTAAGFVTLWDGCKQSKVIQLHSSLHSDLCTMPTFLLPGIDIQINLTKAKRSFCLMHTDAEHSTLFKFLDSKLFVRRIRENPFILLAHNETLNKGVLPRYKMIREELMTFTFSIRAQ